MPERCFETVDGDAARWTWVLFESDEGDRWCGSFREARTRDARAVLSPDDEHFFVIAGGVCYCVRASTMEEAATIDGSAWHAGIALPDRRSVALADYTNVAVVDIDGSSWRTPRVAWDGIQLVHATGTTLFGIAETGHGPAEDRSFTVDLTTREVTGGHAGAFR